MFHFFVPVALGLGAYFFGTREAEKSPSMRLPVGSYDTPFLDKRALVAGVAGVGAAYTDGPASDALAGLAVGAVASLGTTEYRRWTVQRDNGVLPPGAPPGQLPAPQSQQVPGQRKFFVPFRI